MFKKLSLSDRGDEVCHGCYNYFMPKLLNQPLLIDNMELLTALVEAYSELSRLNVAYTSLLKELWRREGSEANIGRSSTSYFREVIREVMEREARSSCSLASFPDEDEDLLQKESKLLPADNEAVQNYLKAMEWATEELNEMPLSSRFLRGVHQRMIQGEEAGGSDPGEFRTSQTWVGDGTIDEAFYIPPRHTHVIDLMSDFELFIHNEELEIPHLIKAGMLLYQLETILPFRDGNGRLARMIVPLYLVNEGLLPAPILTLSTYFRANWESYRQLITNARSRGRMVDWLIYFLKGVSENSAVVRTTLEYSSLNW